MATTNTKRGKEYLENIFYHKFDVIEEYVTDFGYCGVYESQDKNFYILVVETKTSSYVHYYPTAAEYEIGHALEALHTIVEFSGAVKVTE